MQEHLLHYIFLARFVCTKAASYLANLLYNVFVCVCVRAFLLFSSVVGVCSLFVWFLNAQYGLQWISIDRKKIGTMHLQVWATECMHSFLMRLHNWQLHNTMCYTKRLRNHAGWTRKKQKWIISKAHTEMYKCSTNSTSVPKTKSVIMRTLTSVNQQTLQRTQTFPCILTNWGRVHYAAHEREGERGGMRIKGF